MSIFYKCCHCNTINFNKENNQSCSLCNSSDGHTDLNNHFISIDATLSCDDDLLEWCEDNSDEDLLITSVDEENGYVWVEGCPFHISHEAITYIHG